jgi:hypothetical protein
MEAVEDVESLAAPFVDHPQVRLPHVRAYKLDLSSQVVANEGEEPRYYGANTPRCRINGLA